MGVDWSGLEWSWELQENSNRDGNYDNSNPGLDAPLGGLKIRDNDGLHSALDSPSPSAHTTTCRADVLAYSFDGVTTR